MKFLLLMIVIISCPSTKAQTLQRQATTNYTGLSTYSSKHADVFSFINNQASLARLKNAAVGIYSERRFMVKELNNYTAAITMTKGSGNFGLKAAYSGFIGYNESELGLAYGRKLGNKLDLGIQFNFNSIDIGSYGNASTVSFELGTIMHLTDKLNAGIHVSNPVGGKFGKESQEKLPSIYTVGIGYDASEKFFISMEVEKEENLPVNVNAGVQYKFVPQLLARCAVSSATSSVSLGVGLILRSFRVDINSSYHPQLGITPGLMLLLNFKNK